MRYPHEQLAANPHDRIAVYRTDEAWLAQRWQDPASRVLVVAGTRFRLRQGQIEWLNPDTAPQGLRVLLGERAGVTSWAVLTDPAGVDLPNEEWLPLRGLLPALADTTDAGDTPLLLHASGLAEWHWSTRFCPRCGGGLQPRAAGHELACTLCGVRQFPRIDPAVIMTVSAGEPGSPRERLLLGRQSAWPERRFSTLAGFCEPGETAEDAVRREVQEETGILVGAVEYVGSQGWPFPASLMLGYAGRAISEEITVDHDELADARWWTREEMAEQASSGELVLPGGVSISRSLVERWYGGPLPGSW